MPKEITIYDIAAQLRLSAATVSRALNDHPAVNQQTKAKIAKKATEMGYRSNMFASNLRRQQTNTIGVIVPRLDSAFMSSALSGMEKVANQSNYNLLISQSLESVKKEKANAKTMFDSRVDGLLVSLASDTENLKHFDTIFRKSVPLILFDRVLTNPHCTTIVIDNHKAGYDATKHLIEQGCRRIMYVGGNSTCRVYADRLSGYKVALSENHLPDDQTLIKSTNLTSQDGIKLATYISTMNEPPDGLFISSDLCAATCMNALRELGFCIPKDIAVVGFNNEPVSLIVKPNLTTIHYPGQEMGEVAAQALVNHLQGMLRLTTTSTILLSHKLLVRASSARNL